MNKLCAMLLVGKCTSWMYSRNIAACANDEFFYFRIFFGMRTGNSFSSNVYLFDESLALRISFGIQSKIFYLLNALLIDEFINLGQSIFITGVKRSSQIGLIQSSSSAQISYSHFFEKFYSGKFVPVKYDCLDIGEYTPEIIVSFRKGCELPNLKMKNVLKESLNSILCSARAQGMSLVPWNKENSSIKGICISDCVIKVNEKDSDAKVAKCLNGYSLDDCCAFANTNVKRDLDTLCVLYGFDENGKIAVCMCNMNRRFDEGFADANVNFVKFPKKIRIKRRYRSFFFEFSHKNSFFRVKLPEKASLFMHNKSF